MNDNAKHSAGANSDMHERARIMIALSAPEGFSDAGLGEGLSHDERVWVAGHLESCARCREFAENSREAVLGLRRHGVTASGSLISETQVRVRQRAEELKRQQERLWVVSACCAAVALGTTVSTAVLWRGFEWMGQQARLSLMLWVCGFVLLSLMPSVLAGIVLLARGTYFSDHEASHQE